MLTVTATNTAERDLRGLVEGDGGLPFSVHIIKLPEVHDSSAK